MRVVWFVRGNLFYVISLVDALVGMKFTRRPHSQPSETAPVGGFNRDRGGLLRIGTEREANKLI